MNKRKAIKELEGYLGVLLERAKSYDLKDATEKGFLSKRVTSEVRRIKNLFSEGEMVYALAAVCRSSRKWKGVLPAEFSGTFDSVEMLLRKLVANP